MIVSFIWQYLTKEEYEQHEDLMKKAAQARRSQNEEAKAAAVQYIQQATELEVRAIDRYIEKYPTPEAITGDIERVIDDIPKEEYIRQQQEAASLYKRLFEAIEKYKQEKKAAGEEPAANFPLLNKLEAATHDDFPTWCDFVIDRVINCQLVALMKASGTEAGTVTFMQGVEEDLQARIFQKLKSKYLEMFPKRKKEIKEFDAALLTNYTQGEQKEQKAIQQKLFEEYMPMFHSTSLDELARFTSRDMKVDRITGNASIIGNDVNLLVKGWNKLTASIGINTHKLLATSISGFTRNNSEGSKEARKDYIVPIPLIEYCTLLGYISGDANQDATKAQNALKDAKKKIRKDAEILRNSTIKVPGQNGDFIDISIIGTYGIKKGMFFVTIDPAFGEYLTKLPITPYPAALLGIDARKPNAYLIGLKLSEYFCMDRNQRTGQADRIKVKNILKATQLPTIKEVREKEKSWNERIKEPFENTLDFLTASGFLTNWEYCKPKGEPIPDKEASFDNYEAWSNTLLHFTLANSESLSQQIKDRVERSIERAEKKKAITKKTTKKTGKK